MSDDFHRPTYTSADADNYPTNAEGRYNPTQVRLYGIPGKEGDVHFGRSVVLSAFKKQALISIDLDGKTAKEDVGFLEQVVKALKADPKKVSIITEAKRYWQAPKDNPNALDGMAYQVGLEMKIAGTVFVGAVSPTSNLSVGIMFGYAFEGHTYDFPKPKIMLVPSLPMKDPGYPPFVTTPKDDSGYDRKYPEGYRVWIVDKLDQCVEIEANQGFVEQVVLEANLPGKRSTGAYRAAMALSHRGGRLSE